MSGNEAFWWVFVTIVAIAAWLLAVWFITMPSEYPSTPPISYDTPPPVPYDSP